MPGIDARAGLSGGADCDASAACRSGACILGTCSDWAHGMRITIASPAAGTDLRQAVNAFPLLVRLSARDFDFGQARADGADIRFVDPRGRSLDHQTERWAPALGTAELWVSVPRVEPGRTDNDILMYWGNPLAASHSSGPSVFGAFAYTLHMDAVAGIATELQNAAGPDNAAALANPWTGWLVGNRPTEGIAASGLPFDGSGASIATTTETATPQSFTVSLWLRTSSSAHASLAAFVSEPAVGGVVHRTLDMDEQGRLAFGVLRQYGGMVTVASLTGYNDGAWHHVVARSGSAGQYLFVDGEPIADSAPRSDSSKGFGVWYFGANPTVPPPPPVIEGSSATGGGFAGTLDEVQVANSELSDDWIMLSHATQRPGSTAIGYQVLP